MERLHVHVSVAMHVRDGLELEEAVADTAMIALHDACSILVQTRSDKDLECCIRMSYSMHATTTRNLF